MMDRNEMTRVRAFHHRTNRHKARQIPHSHTPVIVLRDFTLMSTHRVAVDWCTNTNILYSIYTNIHTNVDAPCRSRLA